MLAVRSCSRLLRRFFVVPKRTLLSSSFALDSDWKRRHIYMRELGLGSDYEWMAAVLKKYVGDGYASAIDVDASVMGVDALDQLDDVVDVIYKLRHTQVAGDSFDSTSYAVIRLFLKHGKTDRLLDLLDDPINYGLFANEHVACLLLDHFINSDDFQSASRVASKVMLQEMFDCQLLNWLVSFTCAMWSDLPKEAQFLRKSPPSESVKTDDHIQDEDMLVFKFPYLKNEHDDRHFDLVDPHELVGKTMAWFGEQLDVKEINDSAQLLGWTIYGHSERVLQSISTNDAIFLPHTINQVTEILNKRIAESASENGANDAETWTTCLTGLKHAKLSTSSSSLSESIIKVLNSRQSQLEADVMKMQINLFESWHTDRKQCLLDQNERLRLQLRLNSIEEERKKINEETLVMYFFENRTKWEMEAETDEDEMHGPDAKKVDAAKISDDEYRKILFDGTLTKSSDRTTRLSQ